ncbi:ogr/Delta-like zinc finger family protein, partial [Salmonella enterica subsp. enterica]
MMRCPFCRTAAHVRTSRYMSESVKESYLQCQNVHAKWHLNRSQFGIRIDHD